ncbi:hypothetical protein SAMN05216456_2357 [Devosia crocina]|uniref:Uncharacterized protein n=1 Tax=Devosia crocina TaxID=429728 RepID=A0A1I7NNK9_9HYPH|nr:hypothetical protein [Devosia crocina]SFV36160.1 hypothetical protein SAMN05216456_2357 [Devosia crocina]
MNDNEQRFTGKWLQDGDRRGSEFSHDAAEFDNDETTMRFVTVEQDGQQVSVWAPADWTDDQVREALTTNW